MALRDEFTASLKEAMKAGDKLKVSTLRLITSALKDRDIEARGAGKTLTDDDLLALSKKTSKPKPVRLGCLELFWLDCRSCLPAGQNSFRCPEK